MANLFNSKLTEEQLFWEQYTTLVREQEFNRKQVETYQRTHNDLPFISGFLRKTHSILTWFFDTRQLIEREEFWKFQLITMKKTALTMSIFNTFVLLLSIIGAINPSSPFLSIDDVRMPLKELLASFCIRLILNSMFLLFFIVVNYFADKSNKFLNVDLTDVWGIITTVILMSKLFTLVNGFVTYLFYKEESRCYGIGDTLSDDAVLFYLFIITLTDMIQAHVYSVYPFRYSSYLLYTIIQFIECSFRFLNCERVVTHFPLRTKIIGLVMLEIIGYFFTMGIMPLATQINLQNTFINLKKQKLIIKDNISFVNLLCQDIKLSTLQHRKVLNQLKVILKPIWWNKITHLYNSVLRLSEIMNIIVDEIVFLVKIEEKRFHFQCSDEIEFTSLFDTIIQMIHTIYQNDSKSEQIHEILSHYFILTIPANQQVQSHLNCLRILLMFSFIATFELLKLEEDGAILDEFIRSHSNSGGALIDVKCVLQHSLKVRKELLFEIRWPFPLKNAAINLSSQDASNSTDFNESQSHFLLKSACVLCDKISRTFAGNWTITATGIEFTCPYEPIQTENVGIFHSDDEEENNRLINFISNECGLIITDSKVEGLVIDAIYQLPGGKEIEIIKDFQNLHIIPHTVLFIQTYTVIERLQQLGFKGKVILLSERLAYLGEEVRTHITYSSQLPWSEESIYNLRNYLFNVMLEKYLPPEQHHHPNPTPRQREAIDATSGKSTGSILHQVENRSISSILMDILRQHTTLIYDNSSRAERIDNLNESYYKWKYLHPLRGWFSRAIVMDLTVFINFLLLLALYVLGDVSLNYVLAEFVSILLVVLRTLLYNKMKNNITFHSIWKGFVWVNALGLIWMMFLDFFRFSENGLIFVPSLHFDSFIDFLQTTVGQLNGLGTLSFIMRSTSFIRYYGEAVPRPFTLWCVLFIGIKQWLILAYFFYSQYLPVAVLSIIGLCFILTLIIWMIYQINAVESVETEFLQLYDRIIANDTFQRCTQLSKLFLIPRLQQLDEIETNILERLYLHSTVLHGKHFLSRRLKKKGGGKDMKSIDDKANYFNDEDDDDEDEEDDESVATFDGTIDKRRGEGVGLGEEINYELPKYLPLPPELIEILLNLQHHKRMTQILCYSLQPLMEDRIVIIPPNSTSNHLSTSPSTMKEKYDAIKKTILVKFKATLIRIIVQDLIQSYIHGGYSTSIKYYLFIHPSIAIVRIDKMLLVTTLSDMIQQSIQRIENRSKSSMSRQNNKMMMSSSMDEHSIDHQLLIWIQPTSTGDIILPYSQIRQLQITVLDTGFFTPEHYTLAYDNSRLAASMTFFKPPLPTKSSENGSKENFEPSSFAFIPQCSEVLKSGYHRLSDQFLEFFDLPHRSEMGILHHCQYHYYQKTALPILLTTRTNEMEKILKNRSNAHTYHGGPNEIVKINALHPRVYSQCSVELEQTRFAHLTQELQEVASLLAPKSDTNEGGVGGSSAGGGSNNNRHQSITMVTASSSLSEATKKKLLDYKERLIQAEKKSKRNIETVLQVLSSMILKIPLDVQQLSRAKQTSASSVTASLESHPGWLRNSKSQSLLTTPSFSLYNSSKTNNPHRKGIVTMFCVNGEETSAKNSIIQYMFKSRYWGCQTHYLEGFPKKKSFQDSDIIIIEYSPRYVRHRDDRFPFSPGEQKEKDKGKERDRDKKYGKKKGKKYRGSGGGGGGGAFSDNESTNNDDFDYDEYESYHPFKYYYCLEMPYNIPQLIHYIRLQGFTGLIVIVYQSAQKRQTIEHLSRQLEYPIEPNPDIDERTVHSLQNPNDYTDAVSANLHITLPWKEETVDNILTEWKKKMIERIFNSNKECADKCK